MPRLDMIFSKSIAFDEEEIGGAGISSKPNIDQSAAEAAFLEKLRSGDARAFDLLVTRYAPDIYGLLFRIMRDPEEARDVTQDTFLRAYKAIANFRGDSSVKTWLFRIAINQSRNRFRWWKRRMREKTLSLDEPLGSTDITVGEMVVADGLDPEEDTLRLERERILLGAIHDLPEVFRESVVLCDIQGFTYEEISEILNINLGTVKSRISRGREELRKRLTDV